MNSPAFYKKFIIFFYETITECIGSFTYVLAIYCYFYSYNVLIIHWSLSEAALLATHVYTYKEFVFSIVLNVLKQE